ncbi:MAG: TIGR03118 family protein [Bacteroidetes bacterium]|nr:MAG: TIGR03118 family protein [Bacteroidota bacterium]
MKRFTRTLPLLLTVVVLSLASCKKQMQIKKEDLKDFEQVNLVDNNGAFGAAHTVGSMMNAWGLTFSPGGIAWVNAEAGHVSELFDKDGNTIRPPVGIPSPTGPTGGMPTGIVFNGTGQFRLSNGAGALFIFVGDDGVLSGWNGTIGPNAELVKNNSATASYFGLTMSSVGGLNYLYAADFKTGAIDVWDSAWNPVTSFPFKDPFLPASYSPFNIQVVDNWIVVNYAKVGADGSEIHQVGLGLVDIFNPDGTFVRRFTSFGLLNSPWGIAMAPPNFFEDTDNDANDAKISTGNSKLSSNNSEPIMLIGNFGDGHINAYSLDGEFIGQLRSDGKTLVIDGLWALRFPPATATAIDPNRLYFTAGPDEETNGLFGYLIKH